ncbi:MAG: alpha-galactosidase [Eubacteriales bacterium]|nr:alpha-galactosidase [Eubacteriales bacterium]
MRVDYKLEAPEEQRGITIAWEEQSREGITEFHIHMKCEQNRNFPPMRWKIMVPAWDIHYMWTPKIHLIKALNLDWFMNLKKVSGFTGAPVVSLIGNENENRATLGLSDTLHSTGLSAAPLEETGEYAFLVDLFEDPYEEKEYELTIRLDTREIPYYRSLADTALWWEKVERNRPAYVPEADREPMYSTWYSFHQRLSEEELLLQCRLSEKFGFKTILLDDGWQTDDNNRGYAYCGDWLPAASKIPDMKSFVKKVHGLGMRVMTWYSVPFIGERSKNYRKFKDMVIDPVNDREWYVLDPRYPQVREFIIRTYEKALEEYDLDGFKLDFVDEFVVTAFSGKKEDERRDFRSVGEAADFLMKECIRRLKQRKPDILLEFRQTYNGPLMRSYGNIFRAVDCPFDALENHQRVTDIRLLAGNSAVHSDMLMWHPKDSAESAALQIIQVLFSVPQISVRLEDMQSQHREMLEFYLKLWKKYKSAFIEGSFQPLNPAGRYSVIKGISEDVMVCTCHARELIQIDQLYGEMVFVNGTSGNILSIFNEGISGAAGLTVYDCRGNLVSEEELKVAQGMNLIHVPRSGTAILIRK